MQKRTEKFIQKPNGKFIKRQIIEEDVTLSVEELDRMDTSCNREIERATNLIQEMQDKKVHISELRLLI